MECAYCNKTVGVNYLDRDNFVTPKLMPNYWLRINKDELYFCDAYCSTNWCHQNNPYYEKYKDITFEK